MSYAFKKDTKGERHGTPAERLLAEQQRSKAASLSRPNTLFATGTPPSYGILLISPGRGRCEDVSPAFFLACMLMM